MKRNQKTRRAERSIDKRKAAWLTINGLDCCILSARPGADLAHLRDLTGMAMKPRPWRSLPLDRALHRVQENAGSEFWEAAGMAEFERYAMELHDAFLADDSDGAGILLEQRFDAANHEFIADILRKAA